MGLIGYWLGGTVLAILGALIWNFAPVLVPAIGVTIGLAVIVAAIVRAARWLERAAGRPRGDPDA